MSYSFEDPLNGLKFWDQPIFDAHIHVWSGKFYPMFVHWVENYYKKFYCLGMMNEDAKAEIPTEYWDNIVFTFYLSTKAFGTFDTKTLLEELDKAHTNEYDMIKIWQAPRMVDFIEGIKPGYRINDEKLESVYQRIQDYNFPVIIHVSDPDLWYQSKYLDQDRYGTKIGRLQDFMNIMDKFPRITFLSAHLGCLPENLPMLETMLNNYSQLYVDTGSTRWMCRELGKNIEESRSFFTKNSDRVLFGTDLSLRKEHADPYYWGSRYWGHKVLWETDYTKKTLPFEDEDTFGTTQINGLALDEKTLENIYFRNAFKLFKLP